MMRVLIACEESQTVCLAFRNKGHNAFSCDILPTSGNKPQWHYQQDVLPLLQQDWDLIIAFPPCTDLAVSGTRHFAKKIASGQQQKSIEFFLEFTNLKCSRVAIENPVGIMSNIYRKPDQIIQPWFFGDPYQKKTCLWLKGLKPLIHKSKPDLFGDDVTHTHAGDFITTPSGKRLPKWYSDDKTGKGRSKTFNGIANAMADQWG